MVTTGVDIRRSADRFHTRTGWLDSRHSFSFGHHHDPRNVAHGLLLVLNDDRVAPGAGFGPHGHRDMEIVTWVLSGALAHRDSAGHAGVVRAGMVQRMTAGSGILHSEMNHSPDEPVHFLQMWVPPDRAGLPPGYEEADVGEALAGGSLVPVASGRDHAGAVRLHQAGAVLRVGRLPAGAEVEVPAAPFVHVFVARGRVSLDGVDLTDGDAARLTDADARLVAESDAEVLVWDFTSGPAR